MSSRLLQKNINSQRQVLKTTKIVVGSSKTLHLSPPESLPPRKEYFVSVTYGRLIETKEAEDMCKRLGMVRDDVRTLRQKFDEEDGSHSDTVTTRGFFHLINDDKSFEKAHMLTKELLRLADIESSATRISFDHFYGLRARLQRFRKFSFGASTTRHFCWWNGFSRNITSNALTPMPSFHTFDEFLRRNPIVFFPLVQVQHSVRNRTLGAKYWERKVREQQLIPPLLTHIRLHHGKLPLLGFKNLVSSVLPRGNTVIARARARALARQQFLQHVHANV